MFVLLNQQINLIKMKQVKIITIILAASALLSSCSTLKESYKTENGITIHTIREGGHSQAYLIVKQQKPNL
jgi:hypothetical protein